LPERRQRVCVLPAEFSTSRVVSTGARAITQLRIETAPEGQSVLDRWLTQCRCQSLLIGLKAWSNACATQSAIDRALTSIHPLQMKHTMMLLPSYRTRRLG
jgi:hypothetical protein